MKYQLKSFLKILLVSVALILPLYANAVVLDNWNDADLNNSGDTVNVELGTTTMDNLLLNYFSMQWIDGGINTLDFKGLDTVFYNSDAKVSKVYLGSIDAANDITVDWSLNDTAAGGAGGFGNFASFRNADSGAKYGDVSPIIFVLDSSFVTYTPNSNNATFLAHVRYDNDCSGWVSDGDPKDIDSGTSCGNTTVPESGSLALLGLGLLGLGLARRKV